MTTIRVLIADDEESIRASLRLLVTSEPGMTLVAEARDGAEAVQLAAHHKPDVVLVDVQMPRMTGLEATGRMLAQRHPPKVIVLTMFDLDEYVYDSLLAGASGFLLKNSPPSEIVHAIRAAADGNALLAPEVTKRLIQRLTRPPQPDARVGRLTARERETLTLIGTGRSNREIAAALFVTPTTVRTYVSRILAKLDARDRAQLVVVAYENGLVGSESGLRPQPR